LRGLKFLALGMHGGEYHADPDEVEDGLGDQAVEEGLYFVVKGAVGDQFVCPVVDRSFGAGFGADCQDILIFEAGHVGGDF
jgi:hypothetical protein